MLAKKLQNEARQLIVNATPLPDVFFLRLAGKLGCLQKDSFQLLKAHALHTLASSLPIG